MSPWARLDDGANASAKLQALSDAGFRLWACGLIYCQANLTDGFIPTHAIPGFCVRAKRTQLIIAHELCASLTPGKGPLWHEAAGGWQVHDYLDWNESRKDVLHEREKSKHRLERWRERNRNGVSNAAVNKDTTPPERVSTSTTTSTKRRSKDSGADAPAPTNRLLAHFDKLHTEHLDGQRAVINGGKDGAALARLSRTHSEDTIEALMGAFFESKDPFILQAGYTVGVFMSQVAKLQAQNRPKPSPHGSTTTWKADCRLIHGERDGRQFCGNAELHFSRLVRAAEAS